MSEFIVLGLIPGTNIQIGLVGWIGVFIVLTCGYYIVRHERRAGSIRFLLIYTSLVLVVRRQTQA